MRLRMNGLFGFRWARVIRKIKPMLTIILVILIILWLGGSFPRSGAYNANWGFAPVGLGTILLIVLLVLVLNGNV